MAKKASKLKTSSKKKKKSIARKPSYKEKVAKKKGKAFMPKGRPTVWSQELQDLVCKYLAAGNYVETAVRFAGINKQTFYNWIDRSRNGEEPYITFFSEVERARAAAQVAHVNTINKAANNGQWQASAWWLERTNPKSWGRKELVRLEAERDENVNSISDEDDVLNKYIARRTAEIEGDRWDDD